jgi:hypothetical protein
MGFFDSIVDIGKGVLGGGVGGAISAVAGSTNREDARAQQGAPEINDANFQYGGAAGGAEATANQYAMNSAAAQGRMGAQADYGQANQDRNNGQAARTQQQMMANQVAARAAGQSPQIAQMVAQRQYQQAAAAQASQAASARGAAGIALAGQTAANNTARAYGDIAGQEQINAANEQRTDEANALGAFSNLRQGDIASQGQTAQQAQYQAGLQQQQNALNDQRSINYDQLANQVRTTQLQARGNVQSLDSANRLGAAGINSAVGAQNAQTNQQNFQSAVKMASGAMGGGAAMGKAKGGNVASGRPYLVGEEGPELVIPKQNAVVIPARPTAALLGRPEPRADGGPMMAGGADAGVLPLYAPEGYDLQQTPEGHAYLARDPATLDSSEGRPSLSFSVPDRAPARAKAAPAPAPGPMRTRQKTPEELMAEAEAYGRAQDEIHRAYMAQGPAVVPRANGGEMVAGGAPRFVAPQTWGTGAAAAPVAEQGAASTMPGVTPSAADYAAVQRLENENAALRSQINASLARKSPIEEERDRLRARKTVAPDTMSDTDQLALRRDEYALKGKKDDEEKKAAEVPKLVAPEKQTLAQRIYNAADSAERQPRIAFQVPTYRPPTLQAYR